MQGIRERLRFQLREYDQEFIERDWREFQIDMEDGNLLNIEEILLDYYYARVGMDDIISTFPPSEIAHLIPGKHNNLIRIYKRLAEEFKEYQEAIYG